MRKLRNVGGALAVLVMAAAATPALAQEAPVMDNKYETRNHSVQDCMRRAYRVADIRGLQISHADHRSIFLLRPGGPVKMLIRCDLPQITLFVAAGPPGGPSLATENNENSRIYLESN